jgi:hypothetical protein
MKGWWEEAWIGTWLLLMVTSTVMVTVGAPALALPLPSSVHADGECTQADDEPYRDERPCPGTVG